MSIWVHDLDTGKKTLRKSAKWLLAISVVLVIAGTVAGAVVATHKQTKMSENDPKKMSESDSKMSENDPKKMSANRLDEYQLELAQKIDQNLTQDLHKKYQEVRQVRAERKKKIEDVAKAGYDRFYDALFAALDKMKEAMKSESPDLQKLRELKSDFDAKFGWAGLTERLQDDVSRIEIFLEQH